ncbi:MAG: ABC transporter ATP-binding protein [Erysipelotrichaceae bacterium]|jgi:ATP-binding cassette subfamily B multidrug efflux pump|nr:ABC transporter ATP-binding protein [Erysipelotrichaceae bacterium]HPY80143.1 ABC transporter ATP-binding protein [Bacilli bacterium]HQA56194.1 ABC transporter ATP-binding protein [Bacilli bacterium]
MPPIRIRERGRAKKGTMRRLLKQLFKLYPWRLTFNAFCIVFNVFANLCSSIFSGLIASILTAAIRENTGAFNLFDFNRMYTGSAMGASFTITANIPILLIAMASVYFVGIFASWWWTRSMAIITQDFMNRFRKKMFNHMQDLPIKYFDTHARGNIMSLYTNDIDTIRQFVSQSLPEILRTTLALAFSFTLMLINSVWMTLIVIGGSIAVLANTKFIGGRASKYFIKQQQLLGNVEGNIEESINGLKVIKVFTHEEKSAEEFDKLNDELSTYSTKANMAGNITMPINGNIGNFTYVLTAFMCFLIFAVPGFRNLTLTSGLVNMHLNTEAFSSTIVTFLMLNRMFNNNIGNLSQQVMFIVMGMAGASRCFDLMDEKPEVDNGYVYLTNVVKNEDGTFVECETHTRDYMWKYPHKDGTVEYRPLQGDIILDHVDFGYIENKLVLKDVSVYARPGQKIAFVGATGAGKTTITNLINRFYDIADGKIRYDGININKIKKADLRRSLGIVLQDTNLFTGTVMENIRYGRLEATDEEVYEAAKIANAYDFITRLPNGFDTMLSGDGSNLSQGQRQLISIARAAVADAPVMILDEATSSIDTRTEKLVQTGMDKLMEGRTVFVIAHRLSTIQNSEAIMVLSDGDIIERGNHRDLISQKGMYYQLYTGAFELE